mmetsp:Transcript_33829/g.95768  ORF Transcript_33829/g.95768 Transcript_33829/m.95768 type:complete len:220 (+) Transcript_33829:313-972(+)|eukprot:CAMPEP_0117675170 /NCGR_PEP_ID=MMETSP0804-20121206/15455_1 /TAXON_ID=1074897 /ORGANISM="Tetraselmis astigmatica, Strain CCMP880" /LENGTH=219 /DNA_ID=CAMNT_0005484141 /DNA_START=254 /DNA_END=913 /DNA_ORIENTATION=-
MAASSSTASPRQSYPTSTVLGNALQVNWEDYNYPPLLRIIHYQLSDVEDPVGRSAVFWAHFNHNAVCVALLLNVMGNSILAGFRVPGKRVAVLYSIFNLVLISMLGLYSFYHCYKGIATQNRRLCRRFYMSYTLLMIFMLLSSLLAFSFFNGWLGLPKALGSPPGVAQDAWVAWIAIEASLWTANLGTGIAVLVKMRGHTGRDHIGFLQMQELSVSVAQ